ncbi:MAG: hypothetical protein ACKVTZ_08005 [Bacteroidia bacterium]
MKQFILLSALAVCAFTNVYAQSDEPMIPKSIHVNAQITETKADVQKETVSEKEITAVKTTKSSMDWMIDAMKFSPEQITKLHAIAEKYDKMTEEVKEGADTWEGKQFKMKNIRSKKEDDLRKMLTVEQMKQYEFLKEERKKEASRELAKKQKK